MHSVTQDKITRCLALLVVIFGTFTGFADPVSAQCCAVGSGNPLASDVSQSTLVCRQFEINTNYQAVSSSKFLHYAEPDTLFMKHFSSNYLYTRISYGITNAFTFSLESGYWINKSQIGLNNADTIRTSGISDIVLFPRYNLIHRKNFELTAGLGLKIPVGEYADSIGRVEPFSGQTIYYTKSPALQASTGSNDFILNVFCVKKFKSGTWRLFANTIYILKGWNPNGEKFGDYASLSIFAGKSFGPRLNVLLHTRFEWMGMMKINPVVVMMGTYDYDPKATGSKKIFIVPQVNYMLTKNISVYLLSEIPVYQYVNKTQIASQFQLTTGLSWRFSLPDKKI